MDNQDSKGMKIDQPADPLIKGRHDFVPQKESAMHKTPPRPAPAPAPKKAK